MVRCTAEAIEAGMSANFMSLETSGTARGYTETGGVREYSIVPFDASSSNRQYSANLRLTGAASKVPLLNIGPHTLGVLGFLEYDYGRIAEGSKDDDRKLIPSKWSQSGDYVVELNPYGNFRLPGKSTLDVGILLEAAWRDERNMCMAWNSAIGANEEAYQDSDPVYGWSTWWEGRSRVDRFFFATGFETSTNLVLAEKVALVGSTLAMLKLTGETVEYGERALAGDRFEFTKTHERDNFKRELWMTGSLGLRLRAGTVVNTLSIDLPLAYLLYQTTRLAETTGGGVLFEHEKSNMFQVQEPVKLRYSAVLVLR